MIDATAFRVVTEQFEGRTRHFYQDARRLVTIGVGLLADPLSLVDRLAFTFADGSPALPSQVAADWAIVKSDRTLDPRGGGVQYAHLTSVRATDASIDALVTSHLTNDERALLGYYPFLTELPDAAQQAVHHLAFACGPHFPPGWPHFSAALLARDYEAAAAESALPLTSSTTDARNTWVAGLLRSCAATA